MDGTVIIADDDRTIRTVLSQALTRAGCRVRATGTIATLWRWIEEGEGDLLITDVILPDGDALDLLPAIKRRRPDLPVIVMSAQNTMATALRATELGAYEYFPKPFDLRALLQLVGKKLGERPVTAATGARDEALPLIGRSEPMQRVYRLLARLAPSDLSVLITGQSGTGRSLLARVLHDMGPRADGPFVTLNLAGMTPDAIEEVLLGRAGGVPQRGQIEAASDGTLFLDNLDEMPLPAQALVLRLLQGYSPDRIRLIAAASDDVQGAVARGQLRADLYHHLNVMPVPLAPLRERTGDIPELARGFLQKAAARGLALRDISKDALDYLAGFEWPGNLRELENLMARMAALCPDPVITAAHLRAELPSPTRTRAGATQPARLAQDIEAHLQRYFASHGDALPPAGLYDRILREVEAPLITRALIATEGNQLKAADLLGINRNTLRKKIQTLDIHVTRGRKLM